VSTLYQPAQVTPDYRFNQQQQQPQTSGFGRGVTTSTAALVIPQVPQQHFLASHQQQAHFPHQQQSPQQQQQHSQHQPALKFSYATALPPPPPLQVSPSPRSYLSRLKGCNQDLMQYTFEKKGVILFTKSIKKQN